MSSASSSSVSLSLEERVAALTEALPLLRSLHQGLEEDASLVTAMQAFRELLHETLGAPDAPHLQQPQIGARLARLVQSPHKDQNPDAHTVMHRATLHWLRHHALERLKEHAEQSGASQLSPHLELLLRLLCDFVEVIPDTVYHLPGLASGAFALRESAVRALVRQDLSSETSQDAELLKLHIENLNNEVVQDEPELVDLAVRGMGAAARQALQEMLEQEEEEDEEEEHVQADSDDDRNALPDSLLGLGHGGPRGTNPWDECPLDACIWRYALEQRHGAPPEERKRGLCTSSFDAAATAPKRLQSGP